MTNSIEREYSKIYMNRIMKRKITGFGYFFFIIHFIALIAPIIFVIIFGMGALALYIASIFGLALLWIFQEDLGPPAKDVVVSCERKTQIYSRTEELAEKLILLNKYEKELATIIEPKAVYNEVFDHIDNVLEFVEMKDGEKNLKLYIKNLDLLVVKCKQLRTESLTTTTHAVSSALINAGIQPKE